MADPKFAMAYNSRGITREVSGDTDGAIADLEPREFEPWRPHCERELVHSSDSTRFDNLQNISDQSFQLSRLFGPAGRGSDAYV